MNTLFNIQTDKDLFFKRLNEYKCIFNKDKLKMYLYTFQKNSNTINVSIIIVYNDTYQSCLTYEGPIFGKYMNTIGYVHIYSVALYNSSEVFTNKISSPTLYNEHLFDMIRMMYDDYINLDININYHALLKVLSIIPIINKRCKEYKTIYNSLPQTLINSDIFSIIVSYL
jgi:hypothetical protein